MLKPYVQISLRMPPALAELLAVQAIKNKQGLSTWIVNILEDREDVRQQGENLDSE